MEWVAIFSWKLSSPLRDQTHISFKHLLSTAGGFFTNEPLGKPKNGISSVQFSLSVIPNSATPWIAARQASLSITNSWSLLKLMSIESVMPSNHLILCLPLLLLPSIFPSMRVFSNESALCIRWPKYWSFSFNSSPSNEYSGLLSFRMDWLDLLAVQGTLKSLLHHHIVWHSLNFWPVLECWLNTWAFILNKSENRSLLWLLI